MEHMPPTPRKILDAFELMKGAEDGRKINIGYVSEGCYERSYQSACKEIFDYLETIGRAPVTDGSWLALDKRDILFAHLRLIL